MPVASAAIMYGSIAAGDRPAAATAGRLFLASDAGISRDTGSAWNDVVASGERENALANSAFMFAQRQVPGTLTTYSNTSGRTYGADRWGLTNENASCQYARVDTSGAPEANLGARFYGQFKKITSTGKIIASQVIEGTEVMPLRGRVVRFQMKAKNSVGSHTLRMVLLQLTAAGTIDTIPAAFVTAFGAASTDPTWGTNLSAIAPGTANANSSIVGSGLTCVLTAAWLQFGGTFTVPTDCKNLVAVIFTDNRPAANDVYFVSEVGLYDGYPERAHSIGPIHYELGRCQRYYYKTFNVDTAPIQSAGLNTGEFRFASMVAGATAFAGVGFRTPVPMRAAPATLTTYNPSAANTAVRNITDGADLTGTSITANGEQGCHIAATGTAGTAAGEQLGVHLSLDAEL